ncbi:MAG: DUF4080 domain-containing protein [Betaproteobacteria bacterium]|nr:DUF4080 domain-containing protein [Betaproteobacteria bacterium]
MSTIVLSTLNARYAHASLGLRCLAANMGVLKPRTHLLEFTIDQRPVDVVERLLAHQPAIVGLGVYIWNVEASTQVVRLLKAVAPQVVVVLGGPEVSHESETQAIVQAADYVITGPADVAFRDLCDRIISGRSPEGRIRAAAPVALDELSLPYAEYTDQDIAHRLIYVEASRGCPFKCEFCLSSLDREVSSFPLAAFLEQMEGLYRRGVRQFKFVDRTFNLKVDASVAILEFFLAKPDVFVHFELVPDRLPDRLRTVIKRFPPGSLQFEIGIQSFNPAVQALINRRQDNQKTQENLRWLRAETQAHLHTDLIVGLPGEDTASFAAGFNRLLALKPHEIQVGILKRLRGTPISRHAGRFGLRFNPDPPYNLLCSDLIDFATLQRLARFARYWDMIGNSGRFVHALSVLVGEDAFDAFLRLSDWLYARTGQTHRLAADRLFDLVCQGMVEMLRRDETRTRRALTRDYLESGLRGAPAFIEPSKLKGRERGGGAAGRGGTPERQARHGRSFPPESG